MNTVTLHFTHHLLYFLLIIFWFNNRDFIFPPFKLPTSHCQVFIEHSGTDVRASLLSCSLTSRVSGSSCPKVWPLCLQPSGDSRAFLHTPAHRTVFPKLPQSRNWDVVEVTYVFFFSYGSGSLAAGVWKAFLPIIGQVCLVWVLAGFAVVYVGRAHLEPVGPPQPETEVNSSQRVLKTFPSRNVSFVSSSSARDLTKIEDSETPSQGKNWMLFFQPIVFAIYWKKVKYI